MIVTIDIDIESARKVMVMASGSLEEYRLIEAMTDEEIKDKVLQHSKCWGIKEVKGEQQ